ncbi:MAG: PD-(D/E)XK nuclease family protein [Pseudomonadota bacterium]
MKLITGPVGSGKTSHLLAALRSALEAGPAFCIVPNEWTASELRRSFLSEGEGTESQPSAIIGDIFLSFSAFVRVLADAREAILAPHEQALLCLRLLSKQKLRYFRKEGISLGIAREAAETIATLKRNLITPAKLRPMLETRGTLKEHDLLVLFESYEEELAQLGVQDHGSLYSIAAARLLGGNATAIEGASAIVFDEFFAPEPGVVEIASLLKGAAPKTEIIFSLPSADEPERLFAKVADDSIAAFLKIADDHEKFSAIAPHEATINVLTVRSPLQEIRFLADELEGSPNDEPVETVLCYPKGTSVANQLLTEIRRRDREMLIARSPHTIRAPVLAWLLEGPLAGTLPRRATLAEFADHTMAELRKIGPAAGWETSLPHPQERGEASRSFATLVSLDAALHSAATSAGFLKIGEISRESFLELVDGLLDEDVPPGISVATPFPLRIVPFGCGASRPMERLLMPEMIDGLYPSRMRERIFFAEADEIGPSPNRLLDAVFPSAEIELARSAFIFHTWLSKVCREAIITWPAVNESGSETMPSSFIAGMGAPVAVSAKIPAALAEEYPEFESRMAHHLAIEEERLSGQCSHPEYHGRIIGETARATVRRRYTEARLSASRLQRYAECPFMFFVESVLGLAAPEDVTREIKPKDRGTIIHTVLERFYRDHSDLFRRTVANRAADSELDALVERLADDAFREHASLIAESSAVLHPFEKRSIRKVVHRVIEAELSEARELPEPLFPSRCEWAFGENADTALKIPVDGGEPALLQGRIDRIDLTSDSKRFLIVDYKTGRRVESIRKDLERGQHLQLPIYVEAVRRLLIPSSVPLGGVLLAVMTAEKKHGFLKKDFNDVHYSISKRSHAILKDDEWNEILDAAIRHTGAYVAAIREGKFATTEEDCPRHCKLGDVCRRKN